MKALILHRSFSVLSPRPFSKKAMASPPKTLTHSLSVNPSAPDPSDANGNDRSSGESLPNSSPEGVVTFQLQNSCLLALRRGDITKWNVNGSTDAIVNAANNRMLGGGGVDGAIHRGAGPELYEACLALPFVGQNIRCRTGEAVITDAFRLPVSKIVHTVGPIYHGKESSEPLLEHAYRNSIQLAVSNGIKYLAFPAISCGVYCYPHDEAAEIALNTVDKCSKGLEEVHFVLFDHSTWSAWLSKAERTFKKCEQKY